MTPEIRTEAVKDCLVQVPLAAAKKLQTHDYRASGRYPIIDQGQAHIAGWTDDADGLITHGLPVVVFGDHTRVFKFIDFPFVRGADGTQVLKPRADIDPLFFFYALRAVDLPSRGYNRHFKALKDKEVLIPSDDDQSQIARLLKRMDDAVAVQDAELQVLPRCKRTVMERLFTHGLRGEARKETEIGPMPGSWEPQSILDLCEIWSGGTPRKSVTGYWNGTVPWVSGKDLKTPSLDDTIDRITHEGLHAGSRLAPVGAVMLLVRGMGLAKDLPVAVTNRPMAFNQDVKALVPRGEAHGRFLRSAIYVNKHRLLAKIVPSAHGTMTLSLDDIETFKVPWPSDPKEADEIVEVLDVIDRKIDLHRRKRAVTHGLFEALLHKLMNREVRIADLDLSGLGIDPASESAA